MYNTSNRYLMQIEPKTGKTLRPNNNYLTIKMERLLKNAKICSRYRGFHECICGERSGTCDLHIGEFITNSLAVHYLRWHRDEVPVSEIDKLVRIEITDDVKHGDG